jgi:hypothetical protein
VVAGYFEQRWLLRTDLDVAQFPANRRNLAFVGCEPGIALHRDAFFAEPQRADRAPLRLFLVQNIFRRRYAVDDFLPHRFAQQTGVVVAESPELLVSRPRRQ